MAALFILMMAPVVGWYFLGDFAASPAWESLSPEERAALAAVQAGVRFKLALTLGASLAVLAAVVLFVRRSMLDPLERLAERARRAGSEPWSSPPEAALPDETGDLARALDRALTTLELRAREAAQAARDLGHELRTPLAAIRGAAELLADPGLEPADRERFARHALAESERLERLVDGLLVLARLEREPPPSARALAAGEFLAALGDRYRPWFEARGKRLAVELGPPGLATETDPDRLERALLALLENAEKYSPQGGEVRLAASRDAGRLLVEIADRGPGVPPHLRERVFDRFFTTDRGDPGRSPGSGLGLAIAQGLVHSLGGAIWVEEHPGGGASFRVALPAASGGRLPATDRFAAP
jgi:signal transduction histidine kinase